jgi:hypothetical protein
MKVRVRTSSCLVLYWIPASARHIFLIRSSCSGTVFTIVVVSIAFVASMTVVGWLRNICCGLLDIMDILLKSVGYFRWVLLTCSINSLLILTWCCCRLSTRSGIGLSTRPRWSLQILLLEYTSYRCRTSIVWVSILVVSWTLLRRRIRGVMTAF